MKKRLLAITLCATLLVLTSCADPEVISLNVENQETLSNTVFGKSALVEIGNYLYYDSTTRIVYWWNGAIENSRKSSTAPSPYYAPNGLPYRYNPETNTFEEIER